MNPSDEPSADVIDLSTYDDEYRKAQSPRQQESAPDEVPDGYYDARVEGVSLSRTANTGNPMIIWRLRILGPEHKGRTMTKVRVITNKTLGFVKEDLRRLGVEVERLSDLQGRLNEMVDREIGTFKRTQLDRRWTDVYFVRDRKGPDRESAGSEAAWATGTDDDLPF